ncbi:hypothetical protein [Acinetobacter phage AbTZA1]|uniref:Uncharacterized protein n=1 Tax=Acinetobacter phage AbTZA1 TaxID=2500827 RepID=A0A3T0IGZ9_9CAUD|nr:hypothetical protein HYP74_gp002 [Acinetobacter phage AbTZA1]AZU98690.1 hypothetical protein [Acinetobacter phage AbTZA1]QQO96292.1 hypothetical protein CPT_Minot_089 [Acinetobacter phage Minot]QQO96540.1 hypothetical protein CPT_Mokit_089 [Acinetobacter phage Mokit]QQO96795.1 hypothetical protein CPT_Melin_094 [Acinetobacter phage Melin]
MRVYKSIEEFDEIQGCQTTLFTIGEIDEKFHLSWMPNVLEAITLPRYSGYFNTFDMCRKNAETVLNARCSSQSDINTVIQLMNESVRKELEINRLLFQCFREIGL